MELKNAYEEIVRDSLQYVVCIDDDFIDPYTLQGTDEQLNKKLEFTKSMYDTLEENCAGHVEMLRYHSKIEKGRLIKCMTNKDLLVLDWELVGENYQPALEIIAEAVKLQIPFVCIYTKSPQAEMIYSSICSYFSGYTVSEIEEKCGRWADAGVMEEEFKEDIDELFTGSDRKLEEIKKRLNLEDEESKAILKDLKYKKKDSWYPLWLQWNNAILPEEPLSKAENLSNKAVIIEGKVIVCISKSGSGSETSVCIDELIPSIASHITSVPNSVFDIVWLNYSNSLRKVLQARSNLFSGIAPEALGWFSQGLLEEGEEVFDDFMKGLYRDEIMDCLDGRVVSLPEDVMNDIKKKYSDINPGEYTSALVELNEKITVNHIYSNMKHKVDFGDVFVVEQGMEKETFWLCVTAKCECLRPDKKIDNNYLFIKGKIIKESSALDNAESKFRSFVKYKEKVASISWTPKLNSVYIKPEKNIIDGIGKHIWGNYKGEDFEFTYVCNLKENYAQRMANEAFSEGNKVGIMLAQISEKKKKEEEP